MENPKLTKLTYLSILREVMTESIDETLTDLHTALREEQLTPDQVAAIHSLIIQGRMLKEALKTHPAHN